MSDDTPGRPAVPVGSGGPMAERMQALLARAAEEQLTEQRQVSAVLADLRRLVAGLDDQLRSTTSALGERVEALGRRVDGQGAATTELVTSNDVGIKDLGVRLGAVADDVVGHGQAVDRLQSAVDALSGSPDALAAVQRELTGLQDRLAPLTEVRSGLADLTARTGAVEGLRPEVAAITQVLGGLATASEVAGSRQALDERLDRLDAAVARPALTEQQLLAALAPVLARLDDVATGAAVTGQLDGLESRLQAIEARLDAVTGQLGDVAAAAGGVPAVAAGVQGLTSRVGEIAALREQVAAVAAGLDAAAQDSALPSLVLGVAGLREDVEQLAGRVTDLDVPRADVLAAGVSRQVTDLLVDELAPRVADLVLTRVGATLVEQVAGSVTTSVQEGLTEKVRAATAESERRLSTHVDEAVLALAEALLRRRRSTRPGALLAPGEVAPDVTSDPAHGDLTPGDPTPGDPTPGDDALAELVSAGRAPDGEDPATASLAHTGPGAVPTTADDGEPGDGEPEDVPGADDVASPLVPAAPVARNRVLDEPDQFPEVQSADASDPLPEGQPADEPDQFPEVQSADEPDPLPAVQSGDHEPPEPTPTPSSRPDPAEVVVATPAPASAVGPERPGVPSPSVYREFTLPSVAGASPLGGKTENELGEDADDEDDHRRPWWRPGG